MVIMEKLPYPVQRRLYTLGGLVLYALALDLFLTDNNIAAGGLSGIAIVLSRFVPLGIGAMVLLMNIPILISAVVLNGWLYTAETIGAAVLYSVLVDSLACLPACTDDPLVASVFGGVLYGVGMALITIANASVGGTDLLSRLISKQHPRFSVAKMSLFVDGSIVIMAMFVFGNVGAGLYAIITIFVCSLVCDRMILGLARGSICMVITALPAEQLAGPLMRAQGRAVTAWPGTGMYTGAERNVLILAVRPAEVHRVKELLEGLDPDAFVMMLSASELIGGSFSRGFPASRP